MGSLPDGRVKGISRVYEMFYPVWVKFCHRPFLLFFCWHSSEKTPTVTHSLFSSDDDSRFWLTPPCITWAVNQVLMAWLCFGYNDARDVIFPCVSFTGCWAQLNRPWWRKSTDFQHPSLAWWVLQPHLSLISGVLSILSHSRHFGWDLFVIVSVPQIWERKDAVTSFPFQTLLSCWVWYFKFGTTASPEAVTAKTPWHSSLPLAYLQTLAPGRVQLQIPAAEMSRFSHLTAKVSISSSAWQRPQTDN